MLSLKKSFLPLLALCSTSALAGTMGPVCNAENVGIPCTSGWEVSGAALYLQDSYEGADHFGQRLDSIQIGHYDRSNGWGWGFMIDAGYHFGKGKDLDVNWYHQDTSPSFFIPAHTFQIATTSSGGDRFVNYKKNWDEVNLELGQLVDYGALSHVRYYAGFEYVNLKFNLDSIRANQGTAGTLRTRDSQYNGYGARAGAKGSYGLLDNLYLYADGAIGLTAGGSTYRLRTIDYGTATTTGDNVDASLTVPQLEAKLGGTFGYTIAQGTLSLDAGWMWVNYFDPIIIVRNNDINYYNASFQGPYVGMKWQGDL